MNIKDPSYFAVLVFNKLILIIYFLFNTHSLTSFSHQIFDELSQIHESIFYVLVSCDENQEENLQHALQSFQILKNKGITYPNLNVLLISVSDQGDLQPTIYAKNIEQVEEGLREYVCKCAPTDRINSTHEKNEDKSFQNAQNSFLEVVSIILGQIHNMDTVLLFSNADQHFHLWPNTLKNKLDEKNMAVNILKHEPDYYGKILISDDSLRNVKKPTQGGIFVYQSNVNANAHNNYAVDQKNLSEMTNSGYKIESYRKLNLHENTRILINVPLGTWQIFTSLEGRMRKVIMKSPSEMVIDLLPEWYKERNIQHSSSNGHIADSLVSLGLPIRTKAQHWQLLVDGDNYNLAVVILVDFQTTIDEKSVIIMQQNYDNGNHPFIQLRSQSPDEKQNEVKRFDTEDTIIYNNPRSRVGIGYPSVYSHGRILPGSPPTGDGYKTLVPSIIEVDQLSTFYAFPGEDSRIIFIVRNNKMYPSGYFFHCFYSQQQCVVRPFRAFLQPQEQIQVVVYMKASGSEGSANIVSLISESVDVMEKKVYLYIGRPRSDTRKPDIDYDFVGNCDDANTGKTCQRKKWSVNLWARDQESGLLSFHSEPRELMYTSEFIVGTRDGVTATYSASCCDPKVDVIATDLRGNTYRLILDVEHQHLWFIEITAIVLGSILLILLIAAIVYGIVRWRKKWNERSFFGN